MLIKTTIVSIISFSIALLTVKWLKDYLRKKGVIDIPNQRSSHHIPTPRGGGIGILVSFFLASFLAYSLGFALPGWEFFTAIFLISITGFFDDRFDLPVYIRLFFHLSAALLVIFITGGFHVFPLPEPLNFALPHWLAIIFNVIWIISVLNFFNFLDGIDGYAGTQTFVAGFFATIIFWGTPVAIVSVILASAALGFLIFNWNPSKIFMGDTGSAALGFTFAVLPFYAKGIPPNTSTFIIAVFLWFFLADGAFTMIRRAFKGEKVWEAHRSHLYQRLVITGKTHGEVVLMNMGLSFILSSLLVYNHYFRLFPTIYILMLGIIFFMILHLLTVISEKSKKKGKFFHKLL